MLDPHRTEGMRSPCGSLALRQAAHPQRNGRARIEPLTRSVLKCIQPLKQHVKFSSEVWNDRVPDMEIIFELTQQDFYQSFIAHRDRSAIRKWAMRVFYFTFLILIGLGVIAGIVSQKEPILSNLLLSALVIGFWAFFYWGSPWMSARNQYLKQPNAHGPRTVLLNENGMRWVWKGGDSNVSWDSYIRFLESKGHFLLYTSPACFNILPKRVLTP
jgi:hypothetical protein